MGIECGKLKPSNQQLEDLLTNTSFSHAEIRKWYRQFYKDFPDGVMTRSDFAETYARLFPGGDATELSRHVFRTYDRDGSGTIDFREFLCSLSVASKGSLDEKLRWAFQLYDLDGDGYVARHEATEIINAIFKFRSSSVTAGVSAEQAVEAIFSRLDKDDDRKLSLLEFVVGAKNSPELLSLLNGSPM